MKYLKILLFLLCISIPVSAQVASPLDPGRAKHPKQIGIVIGAGILVQSGDFNVTCDCPAFEGGRGTGFLGGIVYEDDLFKGFAYGATAVVELRPVEALYRQTEIINVSSSSGKSFPAPIEFRNSASAKFTYLTLMPFVKYVRLRPLFVRLGAGLTTIASATIVHRKELLTNTVLSPEGTVESVKVADENGNITGKIRTVEDGEFTVNPFQFSINPAIGLDLPIGKSWMVAPVFQYSFPLTTVSERGNNFKLNAWQIMAEVRYIL